MLKTMAVNKPDPKYLNDLVMRELQQPAVFHGLIGDWPASVWSLEDLASILGDKMVKIRIGLKEANQWDSTQWEGRCSYETTTLNHFCEWVKQGNTPDDRPQDRHGDNPLMKYCRDKHWCYVDYKYMVELFEDHPYILESIKWSDFGFSGRNGQDSTIWIGSEGATTPGHYDTYGCNLVAQIYGRKRWHLFPPSQSDALYQTRIPYEESSIFSPINIAKPDLTLYPEFSTTTPYTVTLDPGDVLFVPQHWWHFVETIETSISVNSWMEMETDRRNQFGEAITRALVSGLLPQVGNAANSKWINPTEEICDTFTNMECLKMVTKKLLQHQGQSKVSSIQSSQSRQIQHDQDQNTTNISKKRDVTADDSTQNGPCKKKQKQENEMHSMTQNIKLPDCVTLVPCLGQIYMKGVASSCEKKHTCYDASKDDGPNGDIAGQISSNRSHQEFVNTPNFNSQSNLMNSESEKSDVFDLFLQSVTHPQVVSHIADIFLKKFEESNID